jgi:alanyl-tRNA synthetase
MDVETRTHTALHVLKGAVQKVLGAELTNGVYVGVDSGRLSVQFDRKPTDEEMARVEAEANGCVKRDLHIEIIEMDRSEADAKYGKVIYDAFPIPANVTRLKIANIEGWNTNACNKEHTATTGEVGRISIDHWRFREPKQTLEISFKVFQVE